MIVYSYNLKSQSASHCLIKDRKNSWFGTGWLFRREHFRDYSERSVIRDVSSKEKPFRNRLKVAQINKTNTIRLLDGHAKLLVTAGNAVLQVSKHNEFTIKAQNMIGADINLDKKLNN